MSLNSGTVLSSDPDWWRGAVIYQIYPRSFADTNQDGTGDLPGITERLDYVASLGVDAIWISPVFVSPMDDFGYDVSDHCDIDPLFGSLADFDALVERAHQLGLRVMIDLVLSHTSDRHVWFKESRADRSNPKSDWYVWADPKPDGTPPNNWLSIFGGSAWEWDTSREQYYLHNFLISQPDLNFHNDDVRAEILKIVRFWLDRNVDGFRLDTANFYYHDKELRDNPPAAREARVTSVKKANPYAWQFHEFDKTRPENLGFLAAFRALLDEYDSRTSVGELGLDENVAQVMSDYTKRDVRLHMAYSFSLFFDNLSAAAIQNVVEEMDNAVGDGWPAYAMSNHDVARVVSRYGVQDQAELAGPLLVALLTCLRGSICLYQGEELSLEESDVPFEQLQDPYGIRFWPAFKGRDGCRTPMPWSNEQQHAGFSTVSPWLPMDENHAQRAVDVQERESGSSLHQNRAFLNWRRSETRLQKGAIRFLEAEEPVLMFERGDAEDALICTFNLSADAVTIPLPKPIYQLDVPGPQGGSVDGKTMRLPGYSLVFGTYKP